jgi:hypothetical protein
MAKYKPEVLLKIIDCNINGWPIAVTPTNLMLGGPFEAFDDCFYSLLTKVES